MGVLLKFILPGVIIVVIVFVIFMLGKRKKRIDKTPFASGWTAPTKFIPRHIPWLFFAALFLITDMAFLLLIFSSYAENLIYVLVYLLILFLTWILIAIEALKYM